VEEEENKVFGNEKGWELGGGGKGSKKGTIEWWGDWTNV
jgi:hypothetical protein